MFEKILIANRGEIAVRIARTARRLGIKTVAVYSDADYQALHVRVAGEAFRAGPAPAKESYLDAAAIIAIARRSGAEAIHPGYGFLSENPDFAEAATRAGLIFIGPPATAIRAMGLKDRARMLMAKAGVPVLPGYNGENQGTDHLGLEATRIGFPVLIKPIAGGGGKGMHRVDDPLRFADELASARREAASSFGDDRVLIEKFLAKARHIEIQVFADSQGNTIHLFERDCSLQRRHQKVIEEAPAPGMTATMRAAMGKAAVDAAKAVGYVGAGTVEFIADVSGGLRDDRFYFMEMNTRLQVEHPVTEMIAGLDLVEWQLRIASGEPLPLRQNDLAITGHAIEARLYAEDPARNFQPQTGRLAHLEFPEGLRIDTGFSQGDAITTHYDPMIAKLIAHGPTRAMALHRLTGALAETRIAGCRTNLAFLNRLLRDPSIGSGDVDTGFIERNIGRLGNSGEPPLEAIATALLCASGHLSKPASRSPFDTLTNFRLWHGEVRTFTFEAGGTPLEASLIYSGSAEFEVLRPGQSLRFCLLDHDATTLRLVTDGRIVPLTCFHHGNVITIGLSGAIHEFAALDVSAGHDEEEAGGMVIAPMPGLVSIVNVKAGDRVTKGDTIAVTEAMKMEFTLRAPCTGKVAAVHVAAGEQVAEGAVIATIEDNDA
jgi:3-methylcrotonyl-CoA carboxylase alpha subunit